MNMVDFQEKMDPTHRMYLCRMINVKNLSEDLLERYAQVKRLVDRIDGHLTPGDLAMIIMSVRFNPEIATATELLDAEKQAEEAIASGAAMPVGGTPYHDGANELPVEMTALDASDDKVIEEAVEDVMVEAVVETMGKMVEEAVEPSVEQLRVGPVSTDSSEYDVEKNGAPALTGDEEKDMLWSLGMPVRVLHKEEIMQGRIVGISGPSEVGKQVSATVKLTVEFEGGEIITVTENEVEAD